MFGLDWFYVITIVIFVALLYIGMCLLEKLFKKKLKPQQHYIDNVNSLNVTPDEFYKVLNFMLMYGIIDLEDYNKIQLKGLPFTG
ncbi:MAG TPA: hypothetical protein VNU45_09225 [Rummeliibacillus sp.]|nr:hypothetical protein [Rummeliibacillus sp.]